MKKLASIFLIILVVLGMSGCQKYKTYTEINYSELKEKMEAKDTFVMVFGAAHCTACAQYRLTMDQVIKDKQVQIFYLDMDKLIEEEDSKLYSEFVVTSTPTTVFFKDGKQTTTYDRIVGSADYEQVVKELIKHGYVEEK